MYVEQFVERPKIYYLEPLHQSNFYDKLSADLWLLLETRSLCEVKWLPNNTKDKGTIIKCIRR